MGLTIEELFQITHLTEQDREDLARVIQETKENSDKALEDFNTQRKLNVKER